ncbi:MAG: uridine kinase family protein [Ornithinimicrobium sp.]|uniref:uridine kinase family protein n=1 Tax=Ornithinimicrobium sp. TaxID=1977084 RepID=UPI003D9ACD89
MTSTMLPGEPEAGPWRVEALPDVAARLVPADAPAGRRWIIAVDGRSGSGMTSVATRLAQQIAHAVVLHTDHLAWHESLFDWHGLLIEEILQPFIRGEAVSLRPPAWQARGREGSIEIPASTRVLVMEGVGAGRRELCEWADQLIWVQSDADQAAHRGIERDGGDADAEAFWNAWMRAEIPFLLEQRPWCRADLLVCGTPEEAHDPDLQIVTAAGPSSGVTPRP